MGEDGHTCSLFPNHALLSEEKLLIASISDSPKPPPQRVTFTYPLVNNARSVVFVAAGAGKRVILPQVLSVNSTLPSGRVKATKVVWMVDSAAAADVASEQNVNILSFSFSLSLGLSLSVSYLLYLYIYIGWGC